MLDFYETLLVDVWVFPKNQGIPKMDGEKLMENPMNKWDDFWGKPIILGKHPYTFLGYPFRERGMTRLASSQRIIGCAPAPAP